MLADAYYDFKAGLDKAGIIISYCGYVSENVLFGLGDTLKQHMSLEQADRDVTRRVFSIFVEQVQNIIRYSGERLPENAKAAEGLGSGIVVVGAEDGGFFVACANIISKTDVPRLRQRLEHIATLDREGLKAFYKQVLKSTSEPDSLGGSVGLIEIARRSSQPIQFAFKELEDDKSFFCVKAFI